MKQYLVAETAMHVMKTIHILLRQQQQQFTVSVWAGSVSNHLTGHMIMDMSTDVMEHQHTMLVASTTAWMLHFLSIR
jgi:hypothetical protein